MWCCPIEIESALWAAARERLPASVLREDVLERAVVARSRRYTSDRDQAEPGTDDSGTGAGDAAGDTPSAEQDLAARALFFTIADAAKVQVPLDELATRGLLPGRRPLRIADVGAGAGAMTLGTIGHLRPRDIEIRAFDRDRDALMMLRAAVAHLPSEWREPVELRTTTADVRNLRLEAGAVDLALVGSLLNELAVEQQRALVHTLLDAIGEAGALIIIEPALRETSRALHELRDYVIASQLATVYAPCVRTSVPCPALDLERDWCHEDRPTALPERTARLVRRTGLRRHGLKFSYLVLRRGREALIDPSPSGQRMARVVSQPRKLKGRRECFACGEDGRSLVRLLKRNRGPGNRAFESARRGDVLALGGSDEIAADDTITRLVPTGVG